MLLFNEIARRVAVCILFAAAIVWNEWPPARIIDVAYFPSKVEFVEGRGIVVRDSDDLQSAVRKFGLPELPKWARDVRFHRDEVLVVFANGMVTGIKTVHGGLNAVEIVDSESQGVCLALVRGNVDRSAIFTIGPTDGEKRGEYRNIAGALAIYLVLSVYWCAKAGKVKRNDPPAL